MEIVAHNLKQPFLFEGFAPTKFTILIKDSKDQSLKLWGAYSKFGGKVTISLGAVSPKVNQFALRIYRKASGINYKSSFPAKIAPPIYISNTADLDEDNYISTAPILIQNFTKNYGHYDEKDWFDLAREVSPFGHAQRILIPAYFHMNGMRRDLNEYCDFVISKIDWMTQTDRSYFEHLRSL